MSRSLIERIKEEGTPILILICGMPGTRKSSTAVKLAAALNFTAVVGMDEVRDVMQIYDRRPVVQGKSHDRWKIFGKPSKVNFIRGFLVHCRALRKGALAIIRKNAEIGENIMIEGVHLVPSLYQDISEMKVFRIMLVAQDHVHHKELLAEKFRRRHGNQAVWLSEKIWHIEQIQEFLLEDARNHCVEIIISATPEENCDKIIAYLKNSLS